MFRSITRTALTIAAVVGFALVASQANAANERFKKVLERGKVVVGVKADYKPWGFRDSSGNLVGMEIDMAKDVAKALGVKLELVPVQSSNRMQFLQQGKIDMMIATMSDKANRRKVVGIPDPNYYTSGTNVLAKKGAVSKWEDLRGKPVCGKQGAFYNKIVSKRYGAKIVAFVGNAEAKQALRDGKCIAWVYDDSSIMADLASGEWNDYAMPLNTEDDTPWGLAVPKEELGGIWGNFMSGMIYNWHRTGRLIDLEKKWGIQPTSYLQKMNKKFEAYTPK
ncbi:MAG: transporter substrate-binding domain-containing protein [Alphaproteobacteria bacterium]